MTDVRELVRTLATHAEVVCRHYLSNGHREGRYWFVGDIYNTPGRSTFVRLVPGGNDKRVAGKWTDAATGEHGDLLDMIGLSCGLHLKRDTLEEARRFLSMPLPEVTERPESSTRRGRAATGTAEAARRLFASAKPTARTIADAYLRKRLMFGSRHEAALRFHPNCHYRPSREDAPDTRRAWPAMIAAVTDLDGNVTGVQRTWIDPVTLATAPVATPRRAMGNLLGHGVRFGAADDVMIAGEGIETMLSLRVMMPGLPMVAALSAAHLGALLFPARLRRLYVARDDDRAGERALAVLTERGRALGVEIFPLLPHLGDFNDDQRLLRGDANYRNLKRQLVHDDATRFLRPPEY
ncbi:toprim domain-containing protein [Sphingomonas sp. RT2P30]|uniref:DUF7146 domain-containing protein n=1 Tax=Parasphingomonas halimpatiens TaxID=3096162 RepID=UPI003B548A2D